MKTRKLMIKIVIAAVSIISISGQPLSAKTLRMSSWLPPVSPVMKDVFVPWTEKIAKVTEGRVKIKILNKTVGSVPGQFDVASTGQVDIAFGNQSYTPGRFKEYAFVELPGNGNSAESTSVAFWRTYNKFFGDKDELGEAKLLALFTNGPGQLFTTTHKVTGMTGNNGIKVRGGGEGATRIIELLGMTSIQAPFSKAAEMMTNRVVDGIMLDPSVVPAAGFTKYLKYRFVVDGGLYNVSYFVVMNKKTWNSISKKDQKAIDSVSGEEFAREMGQIWDKMGNGAEKIFDEAGMITTKATGAFEKAMTKAFLQFENDWIAGIKDTGVDGRQVVDFFRAQVKALDRK